MIADIVDILATARSGRIVRATLSARRIGATFAEVRGELSARTLHAEVRKRDRATRVLWSLWIGRFQKPVPWLVEERFKETRYAFLLLLERDGFVGVLGSNIGNIADFVSDDRVSYQKLLALHSDADTEIESLSTRSLRAARVGVMQSTQRGSTFREDAVQSRCESGCPLPSLTPPGGSGVANLAWIRQSRGQRRTGHHSRSLCLVCHHVPRHRAGNGAE